MCLRETLKKMKYVFVCLEISTRGPIESSTLETSTNITIYRVRKWILVDPSFNARVREYSPV